jgi:hypothetical protein
MALRNYMQDLMRAQNVSRVHIVHDASIAALPEHEDPLVGSSSISSYERDSFSGDTESTSDTQTRSLTSMDDSSSQGSGSFYSETAGSPCAASPGSSLRLGGFRERHRRIKEILSPVKVYKWSPSHDGDISQRTPTSAHYLSSPSGETALVMNQHGRDDLRSRLVRLASDSNIIDGPPALADTL